MRNARARATLACTLMVTLAACQGSQSTLDPGGPAAQAIASIWWIMLAGACAVFLLVMGLLAIAMSRRHRPALRRPELLVAAGGLALPIVTLVALLVYGTLAGREVIALGQGSDLVVEVSGRQWQWQFTYLDADGLPVATTTEALVLPLDALVEFRIGSEDVIHSFWIPRLGGKMDAVPGRVNTLRLRASEPGAFRGQCAEFCGLSHAHMGFDVDVRPEPGFNAWLQRQPPRQGAAATPGGATP